MQERNKVFEFSSTNLLFYESISPIIVLVIVGIFELDILPCKGPVIRLPNIDLQSIEKGISMYFMLRFSCYFFLEPAAHLGTIPY